MADYGPKTAFAARAASGAGQGVVAQMHTLAGAVERVPLGGDERA